MNLFGMQSECLATFHAHGKNLFNEPAQTLQLLLTDA